MADQQKPWVPLSSAELHVEVNPLGAQLSVFRDRSGRDLLWDGDPAVWAGRAPILFPTIGEVAGMFSVPLLRTDVVTVSVVPLTAKRTSSSKRKG